nr:MAG TPA: RNA-binding protein [Caudoviricetes sp.]
MDSLNTVIIFWTPVSLEAARRRSATKRLSGG